MGWGRAKAHSMACPRPAGFQDRQLSGAASRSQALGPGAPGPSMAGSTCSAAQCPPGVGLGSSLPLLSRRPALRSRSSGVVILLMELKSAARGASPSPPVVGPTPRQSSASPLSGPPHDGWACWPLGRYSCPRRQLYDRPVETGLLDAPLTASFLLLRDRPKSRGMVFPRPTSIAPHCHPRGHSASSLGRGRDLHGSVGGTWGLLGPPRSPLSQGLAWGIQDRWPSCALAKHTGDTATGRGPPVGQRSGRCPGHSDLPDPPL